MTAHSHRHRDLAGDEDERKLHFPSILSRFPEIVPMFCVRVSREVPIKHFHPAERVAGTRTSKKQSMEPLRRFEPQTP